MSFVEREKDKINEMIRNTPLDSPAYQALHAAQQALAWAMDPDCFATPSASLNKFFGVAIPDDITLPTPEDVRGVLREPQ